MLHVCLWSCCCCGLLVAGDGLNDTKSTAVFSFFFTKLHPDFLHQRLFVQGNGGQFFPGGFLVVGQHFDNVAAVVFRFFQCRHAATHRGTRRNKNNKNNKKNKGKDKKETKNTFEQKSVFTSSVQPRHFEFTPHLLCQAILSRSNTLSFLFKTSSKR